MELKVLLTDPLGAYSPLPLHFNVEESSLAKKWARELRRILQHGHVLEKHYNFLGFPHSDRTLREIIGDINQSIDIINAFNWNGRYTITERAYEGMEQKDLNTLHHHFEILIGQVWSPAKWFLEADHKTQIAICFLNNHIHEYEYKQRALQVLKERGENNVGSSINCAFSATRKIPLENHDKASFSLERYFGDVYLHYSQLGKTFEEAYVDGDEIVGDENVTGLRYLSGEFDIYLGPNPEKIIQENYEKSLKAWIEEKGKDPNNIHLGLGEIRVACLKPTREQQSWDPSTFQKEVSKRWNISEISLIENKRKIYNRQFPYSKEDTAEKMEDWFRFGRWKKLLWPKMKLLYLIRKYLFLSPNP